MVDPARTQDAVQVREPTCVCTCQLRLDTKGRIWPVNVNVDKGDI